MGIWLLWGSAMVIMGIAAGATWICDCPIARWKIFRHWTYCCVFARVIQALLIVWLIFSMQDKRAARIAAGGAAETIRELPAAVGSDLYNVCKELGEQLQLFDAPYVEQVEQTEIWNERRSK